ncbi:MAG: hypothetical protein KF760_23790 [Candidatus Eremiobacteraeota bacterium]|nr:hypothetical protein [Candidatus Eremiobacteraeota bacterium]
MQALLKGRQQLAVIGKRNNKWEILFKTGDNWDFGEGSLRYRVSEAVHKEKEAVVIMDSARDDRFVAGPRPEFRSALCFPVTLPGKKQITIFVEEPEHPMGFSLAVLPAWRELAEQLEDLQPAPPPKPAPAPAAPPPEDLEPQPPKEEVNWPAVGLVSVILLAAIGYGIVSFLRSRAESQLAGCTSNLAVIVAASNMYARDHGGHYPKSLDELVGTYMLDLPVCPCAGSNTYGDLKYSQEPPGMSVSCSGGFHRKLFKGSGDPQHWPFMESAPPAAKKKRR